MAPHLLLTYDFPPMGGGIARVMGEIARGYPPGGLIVSTGQYAGARDPDGGCPNRIDRLPIASRRLRTVQGLLAWSRRASTLAREHRVEFVWCGNIKPAAYAARWTQERLGIPYGVMVYGMDLLILQHQAHQSRLKRKAGRLLLQSADVLVAISHWTRDLCVTVLRELGVAGAEDLIRVVPPGADADFFHPGVDTAAVRARYHLDQGQWFLTVARLTEHKGVDTVLHALAALRQVEPDLRYAVIGSGERLAELETLARRLRVADRVRFLTNVPDADLPAFYNLATGYLGVSRDTGTQVEGFGLALVEASACGIPVIGGRSGGIPEAVREGETGMLVEAEDVSALAEAIRALLRDPALAARLGAGGRRAVESFYNWPRMVGALRQIAAGVTAGRRDRPAAR